MTSAETPVGFGQRIRLEWLEEAVALIRAGDDRAAVERALDERLADVLAVGSRTRRNSRAKTVIALLKIWQGGPQEVAALRRAGLELLEELQVAESIAVHWGMTQAAYPFWCVVATHVGRLLRLQATATASQIQRRLRETFGERQTVYNGTNRVLRSFVDWGVLAGAGKRGVYRAGDGVRIASPRLAAWLVESLLTSGAGRASAAQLASHPSLFPFRIASISARDLVAQSPRLDLVRHGYGEELVMLRNDRQRRSLRDRPALP